MKWKFTFLIFYLFAVIVYGQSSVHFQIDRPVLCAAGGAAASDAHHIWSAAAQSSPPGSGVSGCYCLTGGCLSDLFSDETNIPFIADDMPQTLHLEQNYPNPFNPVTTIRFALPHAALASIRLYNTAGRQVRVLTNRYYPPGMHSIVLNARGLSSGTYICTLEAENSLQMKKLQLIK